MLDVVQNKPLGNSEISIQITVLTDLEQRSKVCINKLHGKRQHVSETHFVTCLPPPCGQIPQPAFTCSKLTIETLE